MTDQQQDYRDMDVLYTHPTSKGQLYCGNDKSAKSERLLRSLEITNIVNCTRPTRVGQLPNYHEMNGRYRYLDFPIALWSEYVLLTPSGEEVMGMPQQMAQLALFLLPLFQFVDRALKQGEKVLVHCLAGAHRAGE